jgi:transcriptional regulator with XRE-family HTH domain
MEAKGIGAFIREKRSDLGWTQATLADHAGVERARIAQIESGRVTLPGADHRRRIAKALGVSHLDLLIAAGELAADELVRAGVEGPVEPRRDDWAAKLRDALNLVCWDDSPAMAELVYDIMAGLRKDQAKARQTRRKAPRPGE